MLASYVLLRREIEFLECDGSLAVFGSQFQLGVQRNQRHGGRRRGDDSAGVIVENGVILIFSILRKTDFSAFAPARKFEMPEILAARPLKEITADGRGVANLRGGGMRGRVSESRVFSLDRFVL